MTSAERPPDSIPDKTPGLRDQAAVPKLPEGRPAPLALPEGPHAPPPDPFRWGDLGGVIEGTSPTELGC